MRRMARGRRGQPYGVERVAERDYADPCVTAVVGGRGDGGALARGDKTGAWQLHEGFGTARRARRMGSVPGRTVEPPGWHGRGELVGLMGSGHWGAVGRVVHVLGDMRRRLGRMRSCLEGTPVLPGPVATSVPQERRGSSGSESGIPLNPHCRGILEATDAGGSESYGTRVTRVQEPSAGALGLGGPKRSGNRGASDYGAMFLVERLNQTVSIHPEMTAAPTHYHSPHHSHGCQEAPATSRPRTENPSRADLGGQSRC